MNRTFNSHIKKLVYRKRLPVFRGGKLAAYSRIYIDQQNVIPIYKNIHYNM